MEFPPLDVLQRWMQSVLVGPVDQPAMGTPALRGLRADDFVTSSRRQTAQARLAVYAQAYFARLRECLRSEFPAVLHALGEDVFSEFVAGYLASHPSRSFTLADLGSQFADYLSDTRPPAAEEAAVPDFADFLIDLARLERCYSEVFDGPGPEGEPAFSSASVSALSPDDFAASRFSFHDSVRLLTLRFPCHEYASAVRHHEEPSPPGAEETHLVIFRRDYVVRRLRVAPFQRELLWSLQQGCTVSQALNQAVSVQAPAEIEGVLQRDFAAWTSAPLFKGLVSTACRDQ